MDYLGRIVSSGVYTPSTDNTAPTVVEAPNGVTSCRIVGTTNAFVHVGAKPPADLSVSGAILAQGVPLCVQIARSAGDKVSFSSAGASSISVTFYSV